MTKPRRLVLSVLLIYPLLAGQAWGNDDSSQGASDELPQGSEKEARIEKTGGQPAKSPRSTRQQRVKLIIGGQSQDGRAKQVRVPVER